MIKNLDMLAIKSDDTKENLGRAYDEMVETRNTLSDVLELLENSTNTVNSIIEKAISNLIDELDNKSLPLAFEIFKEEEDLRDEYLSNLKGYFNENTGTWYEQVCRNYFECTGFKANEWTALTYTIHLSLGQSTRDYLLHEGIITKSHKGEYILPGSFDEETSRECGYNVDLIRQHEINNFKDLA